MPNSAPETLTLEPAIARAAANEPAFAAAIAEQKAAALDRKIARTALLPAATYHNQAIYTEPNGVPASRIGQTTDAPAPSFIATMLSSSMRARACSMRRSGWAGRCHPLDGRERRLCLGELEIARRGLVSTIVSLFYGVGACIDKVKIAQEALDHFVELT